eukprot:scaffold637493_cov20-Prasinocladus_malaysianus.AAC.1
MVEVLPQVSDVALYVSLDVKMCSNLIVARVARSLIGAVASFLSYVSALLSKLLNSSPVLVFLPSVESFVRAILPRGRFLARASARWST